MILDLASSRQLVQGADSATAALVAAGGPSRGRDRHGGVHAAVGDLGLLTAAMLLIMALARLGFLADLISRPVLAGFLSAVGVSLIIGKLPWCARPGGVGHELARLVETVQNQGEVNTASALLAPGVMLVMVGTIKTPP